MLEKARWEEQQKQFRLQQERNNRLKEEYDKKKETIEKLKSYYMDCLQKRRFKCLKNKEPKTVAENSNNHSPDKAVPMVFIKSEDLLIPVKQENQNS